MYAVISRDRVQIPPGSVMRIPGSWQDYCLLRDSRGDSSIPKIKYRQGEILLMSPLPKHGREANILADIVKILLSRQNRNYEAFTPITMELPHVGGIEPDYCFYIDNWQEVVGKDRIDWETDPPPDLAISLGERFAIEIDVTSYTAAEDYLPYGIPELWLFKNDRLSIYHLESGVYKQQENSIYFSGISLDETIAKCLQTAREKGTGAAIKQLTLDVDE
jgi:Uma2 family endonuclease